MDNFIKSKNLLIELQNIIIDYNILKYLYSLCNKNVQELFPNINDLIIILSNINKFNKYYDIDKIININNLLDYLNNLKINLLYEPNKIDELVKVLFKILTNIKELLNNRITTLKKEINNIIDFVIENDEVYKEYEELEENNELYEQLKYYLTNEEFIKFIESVRYYIKSLELGINIETIFNFNEMNKELNNIK